MGLIKIPCAKSLDVVFCAVLASAADCHATQNRHYKILID